MKKAPVLRAILICSLAPGCVYIPVVPTARVLGPGQRKINYDFNWTTFWVQDEKIQRHFTASGVQNSEDHDLRMFTYNQFSFYGTGPVSMRFGNESRAWDWGLGMDLFSGFTPIANAKVQLIRPGPGDGFCAALDAEATAPCFQGAGLSSSLFATCPVAGDNDLTAGLRCGFLQSRRPFVPAKQDMITSEPDSFFATWFWPDPGSYQYLDLFVGAEIWRRVAPLRLGITLRFPRLATSDAHEEYPFADGSWKSVDYHDRFQPMLQVNAGASF